MCYTICGTTSKKFRVYFNLMVSSVLREPSLLLVSQLTSRAPPLPPSLLDSSLLLLVLGRSWSSVGTPGIPRGTAWPVPAYSPSSSPHWSTELETGGDIYSKWVKLLYFHKILECWSVTETIHFQLKVFDFLNFMYSVISTK